jgi:DNA invertase Pin-like site-specific DNA recombinase
LNAGIAILLGNFTWLVCGLGELQMAKDSAGKSRAMLEMAAVFARLEREMIRERVITGLNRARAVGTPAVLRLPQRKNELFGTPAEGRIGMLKSRHALDSGAGRFSRSRHK